MAATYLYLLRIFYPKLAQKLFKKIILSIILLRYNDD